MRTIEEIAKAITGGQGKSLSDEERALYRTFLMGEGVIDPPAGTVLSPDQFLIDHPEFQQKLMDLVRPYVKHIKDEWYLAFGMDNQFNGVCFLTKIWITDPNDPEGKKRIRSKVWNGPSGYFTVDLRKKPLTVKEATERNTKIAEKRKVEKEAKAKAKAKAASSK